MSSTYRLLSNILLLKLPISPHVDEITVGHQCGFQCNRSTTDHMFCIHHIPEKKWEQCGAVHKLFVDFKTAYDSVRREVLYCVLIKAAIPMKLGRLKKCLNETYSEVQIVRYLETFPIENGLEQGDNLSPLLFNFVLGYAISKVQKN